VFLARFFVPEHPTFDYMTSRNRLGNETGFSRAFFSSTALTSTVPELKDSESYEGCGDLQFPPGLEWGSSFTLDGEIADGVFSGGASIAATRVRRRRRRTSGCGFVMRSLGTATARCRRTGPSIAGTSGSTTWSGSGRVCVIRGKLLNTTTALVA
jgi:hypothetical protein